MRCMWATCTRSTWWAAGLDVVLLDPSGEHAGRDVKTVRSLRELADELLAARAV